MTEEEQIKAAEEILEIAAAKLGEHFDAVQILVSFACDGGGTRGMKRGSGNWYARQGMAHEFITTDQADNLSDQIAKKINPKKDDD